ncbi:MAG TPA: M23 family metallopeptidase [Devosiaceae bacterium]
MSKRDHTKPFNSPATQRHGVTQKGKPVVSAGLFYALAAVLLTTNVVTLVALFMSPDIANLFGGNRGRDFAAYEDRITQLRLEVDRLHSRQYAQAGDINLQLQELAQQQEQLVEQHQYVRALAQKAKALGIKTSSVPDAPAASKTDPLITGAISQSPDAANSLAAVSQQVKSMMDDSRSALLALSTEAGRQADKIVAGLKTVGISPALPSGDSTAMGGPYEPPKLDGLDDESIVDDANNVIAALGRFKAARSALRAAPVTTPIHGSFRFTSPFGNRRDPFTSRLAFHPGLDLAAPRGTSVYAAGVGTVTEAGLHGGYGNMVEIDHGNGVVSIYGHLSKIMTSVGAKVTADTLIGEVGSTGRSTGPHLHFELRRDDNAINPSPFLATGRKLQAFL